MEALAVGFDNEFSHVRHASPFLCFDVETVPGEGCEAFLQFEDIQYPANYKDPAKIEAFIEDKKRKRVSEAGLDWDLCEVAAISYQNQDEKGGNLLRNLWPEHVMLRKFWDAAAGLPLLGFNIWDFDLPVLLRRSLYLGVSTPKGIQIDRRYPDGANVLDVAHVLCLGRRENLHSLDFYCKRFGIPHDDTVKGKDIAQLVADGEWGKVSHHCYDDMRAARDLAVRIGLVKQAVAA